MVNITGNYYENLLAGTHAKEVGRAMMAILSAVQDFHPHVQLGAMAGLFLLLCDHWQTKPNNALGIVDNIIRGNGLLPEFKGAEAYIQNELQ